MRRGFYHLPPNGTSRPAARHRRPTLM